MNRSSFYKGRDVTPRTRPNSIATTQFKLPSPTSHNANGTGKKPVLKKVDRPTLARAKKLGNTDTLDIPFFDRIVIVSLKRQEGADDLTPYVSYSFPKLSGPDPSPFLPLFCFPDSQRITEGESVLTSIYSFVLTEVTGDKQYGYCRRVKSRDKSTVLPQVYCVISKLASLELYNVLLNKLTELHAVSEAAVHGFLSATISLPIPAPGCKVRAKHLNHLKGRLEDVEIERPLDGARLEHVELNKLFQWFTVQQVIELFGSVLHERRILISCSHHHLAKLSSCVSSLATLIYPLKWECIYIPILPRQMIEVVTAPTPYLIGAMTEDLPAVQRELEEDSEPLLHFDMDTASFVRCYGDESTLLPPKSTSMIQNQLRALICTLHQDVQLQADNTVISHVFLTFMYKLLGHFKDFMIDYQGVRELDTEPYLRATRRYLRPLAERISDTQSFGIFSVNIGEAGDYDQFKNFAEEKIASRHQSVFKRTFS
ncbi:DENN domain-containing protein 2B-like [Bolinopsis microptera]|uniref:DENN domain-containing protein 2B-like n=1 Tax=Bolinopsis microptera TaxID=2820187 RepID=UPI003079C26C